MCYRQTWLRLYKAYISKCDIICATDRPKRLYKAIWNMVSEPTPQQLITQSAHWWPELHPSAYASMSGTRKMHTTLSVYSSIPWRTGSSLTASCLTVRMTPDMSLQPWEPNLWRCMHNGCLLAAKRNEGQPRQELLLSSTEYTREWHTMSTPMCISENLKMLWPSQKRTPKISLHASRHWWTAVRWSVMSIVSMGSVAILSIHTTTRESSLANLWQNYSRHLLLR